VTQALNMLVDKFKPLNNPLPVLGGQSYADLFKAAIATEQKFWQKYSERQDAGKLPNAPPAPALSLTVVRRQLVSSSLLVILRMKETMRLGLT
jgi:hypothetical protein